jgi:hypothetical protein
MLCYMTERYYSFVVIINDDYEFINMITFLTVEHKWASLWRVDRSEHEIKPQQMQVGVSAVVEYSTHDPMIEGLNPAVLTVACIIKLLHSS